MATNEMVDRVAAEMRRQCGNATDRPWEALSQTARKRWCKRAVAVMETMREPTEAMLAAANADPATDAVDGLISFANVHGATLAAEYRGDNTPLKRWWRAMIEAAPK